MKNHRFAKMETGIDGMNRTVKFFCDIGPLVVFFVGYKALGVYSATIGLVVATIIATAVEYYFQRKISWIPIGTVAAVMLMGGLTIWSGNELFIKIKPTIINGLFAIILAVGLLYNKLLVKCLLGKAIQMSDQAWRIFTFRWIAFFITLAVINELVWRNFGTDTWVNFKVFGLLGLTFGFMLTQYPFLKRHGVVETEEGAKDAS
jgi:intracellular septation protein